MLHFRREGIKLWLGIMNCFQLYFCLGGYLKAKVLCFKAKILPKIHIDFGAGPPLMAAHVSSSRSNLFVALHFNEFTGLKTYQQESGGGQGGGNPEE